MNSVWRFCSDCWCLLWFSTFSDAHSLGFCSDRAFDFFAPTSTDNWVRFDNRHMRRLLRPLRSVHDE